LRHTRPGVADRFIADLRAAADEVRSSPPTKDGLAPVYGLARSIPFKGVVSDFLTRYLDVLYEA
jgi:hypothetical protein